MVTQMIKTWIVAARPHTLSASVVPVLVGSALAVSEDGFSWAVFALVVAGAVLVQVGANFTDEYADHRTTDSAHKYLAPHKVIARGLLRATAVRNGALAVFAVATLIGSWLVWRTGWPLLAVCLVSITVAYAYSAGPWPLGDYALSEHGQGDQGQIASPHGFQTEQRGQGQAPVAAVLLLVANVVHHKNRGHQGTDRHGNPAPPSTFRLTG